MLRDVARARPARRRVLGTDACPRRCCSRPSACSRSSTRRASWRRARGGRARACRWSLSHRRVAHAWRRWRRPRGDGAALVPALLAARAASWPRASCAGPSAAGYGALVVTLDTWLLAWRPRDLAARLPAVPQGRRASPTTSPTRCSAPRWSAARRRTRRRARRPVGRQFANPARDLGRPRLAARADAAADRAQGHPAPRRRAPGGRRGRRRDRRLQPRRPPGRRRDRARSTRCPACVAAVGRRLPGPVRQRHPHAGPTSSRRWRWGPTRCCSGRPYVWGLGARRRGGRARTCCAACWPSST